MTRISPTRNAQVHSQVQPKSAPDDAGPSARAATDAFGPPARPPSPGAIPPDPGTPNRLAHLVESVRDLVIEKTAAVEGSFFGVEVLTRLSGSPAFALLDVVQQTRLLTLLGGTNRELSQPASGAMRLLQLATEFATATAPQQRDQLERFLREEPWLRDANFVDSEELHEERRRPFTLTGPTEVRAFAFDGGRADARRYVVEIDGQKIPVHVAKTGDRSLFYHSIDEVAKGLAALPAANRRLVTAVNVGEKRNPSDAFWAKKFGNPDYRAFMTAGRAGVIGIFPTEFEKLSQPRFESTLVHETGHTLTTRAWGEEGDPRWNKWILAAKSDGFHVSKYARNSPGEDFSETLESWTLARGTPFEAELRALMPARFALIESLVEGTPR